MKKLTLLTIASVFLFAFHSSAQITKGSVLLGGGISGSHNKSDNSPQGTNYTSTSSSFSFSPAIGLAIKENTVVGIRLSFYHSKSEQQNLNFISVQEQNGNSEGIFYRRYLSLSKKFYLFGEGALSYSHNSIRSELTNSPTNTVQTNNGINLTFYPGVAFAVNKRIHLEVGLNDLFDLNYTSSKTEYIAAASTTTYKSSGFGAAANFSTAAPLSVGFRFVLGK